jgi:TM2 domain-containing membrane protein YozV
MRGPGQSAPDASGRRYAEGKNPAVALILSLLLTGIGQIYNGDFKKCFVMWGVGIVVIFLTVMTGGVGGFLWLGVWIWSMVDAYNVASRKSPIW